MKAHALRLKPGQDLKTELMTWAQTHQIKSACILTAVGSLKKINLRFATAHESFAREDFFEIVSLVGTFSRSGAHFHISISDKTGALIGGHLLNDNLIYTTAEIIIAELQDYVFERKLDSTTGYQELEILKK